MVFVPPTAGVFDAPAVFISLNEEWRSFIIGVVESLITPSDYGLSSAGVYAKHPAPVWSGDEYNADQQIELLMNALAKGNAMLPGMVQMYLGLVAPVGWLLCDGSIYAKEDYPALWGVLSLHGTTYEDDSENFKAPDLRHRFILGYDPTVVEDYPMGHTDGYDVVTLTTSAIPAHTHTTHTHGSALAAPGSVPTGITVSTPTGSTVNSGNAGGGNQHENMPPYHVLNFIIKT